MPLRMLKGAGISAKGFGDFFERLEPKLTTRREEDDGKKDERKASSSCEISPPRSYAAIR